jgi:hypothetical protein
LYMRLGNSGAGGIRYGVPVSVYAEDIGGYRTLIETVYTPSVVDAGATSDTMQIQVDAAWIENQSLIVVVDDDGGVGWVPECSELNNELRFEIEDVACGG